MRINKKKTVGQKQKILLTFLKQTKAGKYAKIDKNSFVYTRIKVQREPDYEDEYYYGVR